MSTPSDSPTTPSSPQGSSFYTGSDWVLAETEQTIRRLSKGERESLSQALTPRLTRYVPHNPEPPQAVFLLYDGLEALYGGAAGGGKTDALLMAALQYVDVPGYDALLLRRTYPELTMPGSLMDRADEWLSGTGASREDSGRKWSFPSGATLTFGYLQYENDKYRYQSAAFNFVGFDELTHFSETQFRYLFSRVRRGRDFPVPGRVRAASNPGGTGHEWVKMRYGLYPSDPNLPDSTYAFLTPEWKALHPDRVFIPARLDDNPHLDREDYERQLQQLDPVTRAQLRRGDWTARQPGGMFKREAVHVVDQAPSGITRPVRCWDLAATEATPDNPDPDYTVGVKMGEYDGDLYVLHVVRARVNPGGQERVIRATAELDGRGCRWRMEQEPGSAGKKVVADYRRRVLRGLAGRGVPSSGNKIERAKPWSARWDAGDVYLVRGEWNAAFLDEHEGFPEGGHDDQVDAAAGAYDELTSGGSFGVGPKVF